MRVYFEGKIKNGKLEIDDQDLFEMYLATLDGKEITVLVEKKKRHRTIKQNAYYWTCLSIIGNELGYTKEEIHTTFKAMYLVDRTGKIPIVRSTTSLTTAEFTEYFDKIIRKVAELGITLPNPELVKL
jgi:16S rRNA U1498 N3-methylase RsmE